MKIQGFVLWRRLELSWITMFCRNERLLCKFVFVRDAKWRLSTSYAASVMQTFDYERLSSVEHCQCTRDRLVGEKYQDFYSLQRQFIQRGVQTAGNIYFTLGMLLLRASQSFSSPLKILNLHETWHKLAMMVGWLPGDQRAAFNIQMLWLCIHKKKSGKIINPKF